jgi:hypothetical protein
MNASLFSIAMFGWFGLGVFRQSEQIDQTVVWFHSQSSSVNA